jgi:hypothetical protein
VAADLRAVAEPDDAVRVFDPDLVYLLGGEDLDLEPPCLIYSALGELRAAEARWETEVVLDARGGSGLPAGRLPLYQDLS